MTPPSPVFRPPAPQLELLRSLRLLADVESDPEATLDRWMWATVSAVGSRYWDSVWPRFDTDNDSDDTAPVVDGPLMIPVLELVNYATLEQSNAGVGLAVNCLGCELQLFALEDIEQGTEITYCYTHATMCAADWIADWGFAPGGGVAPACSSMQ